MKFSIIVFSIASYFLSYTVGAQTVVELAMLHERGDSAFLNNSPFTGKGVIYKEKRKATPAVKKLKLETKWIATEKEYEKGLLVRERGFYSNEERQYEFDFAKGEYHDWYDGLLNLKEKLRVEGGIKKRLKHGKWIFYYKDGKISAEGEYANDIYTGKWVYYHPNGQKKTEGFYKNGSMEGTWVMWDKDGKVTSEAEINKLSYEKRKKMQGSLAILAIPFACIK